MEAHWSGPSREGEDVVLGAVWVVPSGLFSSRLLTSFSVALFPRWTPTTSCPAGSPPPSRSIAPGPSGARSTASSRSSSPSSLPSFGTRIPRPAPRRYREPPLCTQPRIASQPLCDPGSGDNDLATGSGRWGDPGEGRFPPHSSRYRADLSHAGLVCSWHELGACRLGMALSRHTGDTNKTQGSPGWRASAAGAQL